MKSLLFLIPSLTLAATLDPTGAGQYPAYPAYLDHTCGGVALDIIEQSGAHAMVRASTRCSTGGRGTKPRIYLACWDVTFDANGFPVNREERLRANWLQGQAAQYCPGL